MRPRIACSLENRASQQGMAFAILVFLSAAVFATSAGAIDVAGTRVVLTTPSSIEDVAQELRLEVGKSTFLQTEYKVDRISVGDADIVDVTILGSREIQLLAKKVGNTNVVIWSPKNSPKAAISVTVDSPHVHIQSQLRELLSAPGISVDGAGDSIVLQGSVPNELAVEQAMTIAHAYSENVINLLEVGGEHQVMLEVVVAEMSRTIGRKLGSNWRVISDGGSWEIISLLNNVAETADLVGSFATGGMFWDIFLELVEDKGLGKVLAEPTLVARSGESASFLAGGEIPILIPQGTANNAINLEYKDFGVGLVFEPVVLGDDRISIQVSTQVSEIDQNLGINFAGTRVPAFTTRRTSTTIELADGHSFAIAGLLKETVTNVVTQYPWLGDLPIIGVAFRSSEFQRSETELVILVTPRLAKPIVPGQRPKLPTDYYIEPSSWEFYVFGALEGRFWDESDMDEQEFESSTSMVSTSSDIQSGGLMGGSGLRMRSEVIEESLPAAIATNDDSILDWGASNAGKGATDRASNDSNE
jgi:pilus assembly protein CpaC